MNRTGAFDRDGYAVVEGVLATSECDALLELLAHDREQAELRRMLDIAPIADLASRLVAHVALAPFLPTNAQALQCTWFDKSATRNWSVGPHQDLALPVPAGAALSRGWRAASTKDGLDFAQPPAGLLEHVVAVRVQLDAATDDDGALEVMPGTHRSGRIGALALAELALTRPRVACRVPRGGAVVLRPLLVHGSRRLRAGQRRRVLHFVFASPAVLSDATTHRPGVAA